VPPKLDHQRRENSESNDAAAEDDQRASIVGGLFSPEIPDDFAPTTHDCPQMPKKA